MGNEIQVAYTTGFTVYVHLRNTTGQVWNGSTFETYSAAHYSTYRIALTEQGGSAVYSANFPTAITTSGKYIVYPYKQSGASPAEGDVLIDEPREVEWNGSSVASPSEGSVDTTIALVSLASVKSLLSVSGTAENDNLSDLINQVSSMCNLHVGRHLLSKTYTEYYHGNGTSQLMLKNFPISSVTSLYISDDERAFSADEAVDVSADVMINKDDGILTLWDDESVFDKGVGNIKVTYIAGWILDEVPYALRNAVLNWIGTEYKRRQQQMYMLQSHTQGQMTANYIIKEIPDPVKFLLDKYCKKDYGFSDYSHT